MGSENVRCIRMKKVPSLDPISVTGGIQESISLEYEKKFTYLDTTGANLNAVTSRLQIPDKVNAPVKKTGTLSVNGFTI